MKFPNMVYRCPGSHACQGNSFDYAQVRNEAELHQKLADGWFVTLPEAMGEKPASSVAAPVVNEQPEDLGQQTASAPPQPTPPATEQQAQGKARGKGGKKQETAAPAAPTGGIAPPWGA